MMRRTIFFLMILLLTFIDSISAQTVFSFDAVAKTSSSITLAWSFDSSSIPASIELAQSTSSDGPFDSIIPSTASYSATIFTDHNLAPDTSYYYRLSDDAIVTICAKTKRALSLGITSLDGVSNADRTIAIRWSPVTDPAAKQIRITKADCHGINISTVISVDTTEYIDADFSKFVSTFSVFRYSITTLNSDGEAGISASTIALTPMISFQYADTDGDGILESWDVAHSTFTDPNAANRLIQSFTVETTQVLLIDFAQSSAASKTFFDGVPDAVWIPSLGVVTKPVLRDFDGDGLVDLGIDLDNDGMPNGAMIHGTFKSFGAVHVSVENQFGQSISNAKVTLISPGLSIPKWTDGSGRAEFHLIPSAGTAQVIKAESKNAIAAAKSIELDPWSSQDVTLSLAAGNFSAGDLDAQSYPNPVNGGETIHVAFNLASAGEISMELCNFNLNFVRELLNEDRPAGMQEISFLAKDRRGDNLSSGLYCGVIRYKDQKKILKIVVK